MGKDIFQDPTKSAPKSDPSIIRVPMTQNDIAGREDHIPKGSKADDMSIKHVPNNQ